MWCDDKNFCRTEQLTCLLTFQGESEKFVDQQFWLYFYGMMVTIMVHFVSAPSVGPMEIMEGIYSSTLKVQVFLCCGLFFTSVGGLIVAAILKNLDCVVKVKEYKYKNTSKKNIEHKRHFRNTAWHQQIYSQLLLVHISFLTNSFYLSTFFFH